MNNNRRRFSPEDKVTILRRHLLDKVAVSDLCEEYRLNPNVFYRWQKAFFENGAAAFERTEETRVRDLEKQNEALTGKLAKKDEVIAELLESHKRQRSAVCREGLQGVHQAVRHDARENVTVLPAKQRQAGTLSWHAQRRRLAPADATVPGRRPADRDRLCPLLQRRTRRVRRRLHSALGYLTPKDKLEGRAEEIFTARERKLAQARERRRARRQQAQVPAVAEPQGGGYTVGSRGVPAGPAEAGNAGERPKELCEFHRNSRPGDGNPSPRGANRRWLPQLRHIDEHHFHHPKCLRKRKLDRDAPNILTEDPGLSNSGLAKTLEALKKASDYAKAIKKCYPAYAQCIANLLDPRRTGKYETMTIKCGKKWNVVCATLGRKDNKEPCGAHPTPREAVLCPAAFENKKCGNLYCTLLHEMLHMCIRMDTGSWGHGVDQVEDPGQFASPGKIPGCGKNLMN